ncbi:hemolysin XhlA family protein [Paenibacillus ginsengarvi]|uniref:Hemolysin XhlA n=1 Tax=Paenibacillus ginsengarvi TaxID=400777 RepID=A0A3B0CMW2_9BACL|nr:hemolysin XhlA family protein [Paenibacillus ginsengarvi]RKN86733.1 hemolysin XhlA [Paenibacillus ginsengarvi]
MGEGQAVEQEILQRLTRVETKLDMMASARDTANEALQSTRSAHKRLDKIEDNQMWLWRTVIAALLVGAINLLWKGIGA